MTSLSVVISQLSVQKRHEAREQLRFQAKKNALCGLNIALAKLNSLASANNVISLSADFFEGADEQKSQWSGFYKNTNKKPEFLGWLTSGNNTNFRAIFEPPNGSGSITFLPGLTADKILTLEAQNQYMAYAIEDLGLYPESSNEAICEPHFILADVPGNGLRSDMGQLLRGASFFDKNWSPEELNFMRSFQELITPLQNIKPRPFRFKQDIQSKKDIPVEHGINPIILQSWLEYSFEVKQNQEKWLLIPHIRIGLALWNPYDLTLKNHTYTIHYCLKKFGRDESPEIKIAREIDPGNSEIMGLGDKGCAFKGTLECPFAPGEIKFITLSETESTLNLHSGNKLSPGSTVNTIIAGKNIEINPPSHYTGASPIVPSENFYCEFSGTTDFEIQLEDRSTGESFQSIVFKDIFPPSMTITLHANEKMPMFSISQGWHHEVVAPNGRWEKYHPRATKVLGQVQGKQSQDDKESLPSWMLLDDPYQITQTKDTNIDVACILKFIANRSLDFQKIFLPGPLYYFSPENMSLKNFMNIAWNIHDYNVPPFVLGEGRLTANASPENFNNEENLILRYNTKFWDKYFFADDHNFTVIQPSNDTKTFAQNHLQKNGLNVHNTNPKAWINFLKTHKGTMDLNDNDLAVFCNKLVAQIRTQGPFESLGQFVLPHEINGQMQNSCLEAVLQQCTADGLPLEKATQVDILSLIGDKLHIRSDTFRIHAYGEASNDEHTVSVQCEAVIQRVPHNNEAKFRVVSLKYNRI